MKLFITGATGFIGRNLINRLLEEGDQICINLRDSKESPFDDCVDTYHLMQNEVAEDILWFKNEKFDGIIHLASLYITSHKSEDILELINSNVCFGAYVLECAAQSKIPWFINTGTFWQHYENKEYSPVNLYAATKQSFETIAQYYIETNQIQFISLHLSDTFGPNDTRPKIFNLWQKIAESGETLDMSPGEQIVDISYIEDVTEAFYVLAMKLHNRHNQIKNGEIFGVKAINRYSLKKLANSFELFIGKRLNIRWGKRPYRDREVMIPWENAKVVPGWQPKYSLMEALNKLYK